MCLQLSRKATSRGTLTYPQRKRITLTFMVHRLQHIAPPLCSLRAQSVSTDLVCTGPVAPLHQLHRLLPARLNHCTSYTLPSVTPATPLAPLAPAKVRSGQVMSCHVRSCHVPCHVALCCVIISPHVTLVCSLASRFFSCHGMS